METSSAFRAISGSRRLLRLTTGLTSIAILALAPGLALSDPLPTGANVVSGAVAVATPDAQNMTITQGSDRAVVNWNSFSIGSGAQVTVQQPGAGSALLNRVTGNTTSEIHGRLTANGQVHLVNPNGVFIGPDGRIQAQGMVASTLDIDNGDFMAGRLSYGGTGASAPVRNAGQISIGSGGYAALLGGRVSNSGTVTVPLGRIGFGAGERVTLDLSGDQFLQVTLPSASDDSDEALIDNSGTASANGGSIEMRAATARDAVRRAVNLSGVAEARSVSQHGGTVYLGGGPGGTVSVSGRVTASASRSTIVDSSPRPPVRGGNITITGRDIALAGAQIDASGDGGGGTVLIGGNFAGVGPLPHADTLTGDAATGINVDGQETGAGGRVLLWSDLNTDFAGSISARGGDAGGDGGFVEVSSAQVLRYRGLTDLRAPDGVWGTLLLDPYNITVATTGGGLGDPTVDVGTLQTALGLGSVTLDTSTQSIGSDLGDIVIDADVTWAAATQLSLLADNQININGDIAMQDGSLFASVPGLLQVDGSVTTLTGNIGLAGQFVVVNQPMSTDAGLLDILASTSIFTNALLSTDSGNIILDSLGDGGLAAVTSNSGNIDLFFSSTLALGAPVSTPSGTLTIDAAGDIDLTPAVSIQASDFQLLNGDWSQVGTLAAFDVGSFFKSSSASFLRATGGTGVVADPYILTDIYGLQGIDSSVLGTLSFQLGNNIDASGTSGWADPSGSTFGFNPLGQFASFDGALNGAGFAVQDLFIDTSASSGGFAGGLFFEIGSTGSVSNLSLTNADVAAISGGLLANLNRGTINAVSVEGQGAFVEDFGTAGGFVGTNEGTISNSRAEVAVVGDGHSRVGGFVGANDLFSATITNSHVVGTVDVTGTVSGVAGGFSGSNGGLIDNSYAQVDVAVNLTGGATALAGGFTGDNFGTIDTSYAVGTVVAPGGTTGGFSAFEGGSGGVAASNYWDLTVSGLAFSDGGTGLTTAQFQDTAGFVTLAGTDGWDFATWAPGDTGFYPALYATSPVIYARPDPVTVQYGQTSGLSFGGSTTGGPGDFLFDSAADSLSITSGSFTPVLSADTVGTQTLTLGPATLTSTLGVVYRVVDLPTTATITPAPLTITANDQSKPYGDTFTFAGSEFAATGLISGDTVGTVTFTTAGATDTATVSGGPYAITPSAATSADMANYTITYAPGSLTVTPLTVVLFSTDQSSEYGAPLSFTGTEFEVTGLLFADTVDSVTLTPVGTLQSRVVTTSGGYNITPSDAVGSGLDNYSIIYLPGNLSITPAPLFIGADDISSPYGADLGLTGTEFFTSGLLFDDRVDSVTLTPEGTAQTRFVSEEPYLITPGDAVGFRLENYDITYIPGSLLVTPAPLTITADDVSREYGTSLALDGTEFTTTGLLFDDAIDSVTLVVDGTIATVSVGGGPYSITPSAAVSADLFNYDVTYVPGDMTITPAPRTVTANDQTKQYGTVFDFDGTEFTLDAPLLFGDTAAFDLSSAGAAADAPVSGNPYEIVISEAGDSGISNYTFSFVSGDLTVTPAPLTLTANDASRQYGADLTFDSADFTTSGLLFSDTIDSVTLTVNGTPDTVNVGGGPYTITPSAAVGADAGNYTITYVPGNLTITPAPLTITANDASREYGTNLNFDGTEFTATGLVFDDTVDSVTLVVDGTVQTVTVDGGPYDITPSEAIGLIVSNYDISYVVGDLTVTPAPRTVTANDQTKQYGDAFVFDGTEFVLDAPLLFSDTASFDLASAGAAADADVTGSPYDILVTQAGETANSNYAFTFVPGDLTITPAPLTILADDQTKTFGETLVFDGTEFAVSGLLFDDTVSSVVLTSAGAAAGAQVADGPFEIVASTAAGQGVGNYAINFDSGNLTVERADVTTTLSADDVTKTYGQALTLDSTMVSLTGSFTLAQLGLTGQISLGSDGTAADAPVIDGSYTIFATGPDAVVQLDNFTVTVVYGTGDLTITPAPLTIRANDRSKVAGDALTFDGSEFTTQGLLFNDDVGPVTLSSAGAPASAAAAGSPYTILASNAQGDDIANYDVTYQPGLLSFAPPPVTPVPPSDVTETPIPNPIDVIDSGQGGTGPIDSLPEQTDAGTETTTDETEETEETDEQSEVRSAASAEETNAVAEAQETLGQVRSISASLGLRSQSCGALAGGDVNGYLSCLSDALSNFAANLDDISTDLPAGMENVARIVETARSDVDRARTRAQQRLAGATTDAQRNAIRDDAISEARGAVRRASEEIRKSIALVRVEDPELASLQRSTITETAAALDNVDIELSRVVGL